MDIVHHFLSHRYQKPVLIAHRGESDSFPENTIPAFKAATERGTQWVELDVQLTKDIVPVVMHDPDLKRFGKSDVTVESLTFNELQKIDAGSWKSPEFASLKIPSLNQVLNELEGVGVNIELKREIRPDKRLSALAEITSIIKMREMQKQVIISSFDDTFLKQSKQVMPDIATGLLFRFSFKKIRKSIPELVREAGAEFFHCSVKQVNRAWMDSLNTHNIPCNVYTVNKMDQVMKLKKMGVAGIFSDRPAALSHEYEELSKRG